MHSRQNIAIIKITFHYTSGTNQCPNLVNHIRTPELNGNVERANRTLRYEFYQFYQGIPELGELRKALHLLFQVRRKIKSELIHLIIYSVIFGEMALIYAPNPLLQ